MGREITKHLNSVLVAAQVRVNPIPSCREKRSPLYLNAGLCLGQPHTMLSNYRTFNVQVTMIILDNSLSKRYDISQGLPLSLLELK